MNPPTCRICGYRGELPCPVCWPGLASNTPTTASNEEPAASNTVHITQEQRAEAKKLNRTTLTKQRWNREDYNAYMKGYMRRRRE